MAPLSGKPAKVVTATSWLGVKPTHAVVYKEIIFVPCKPEGFVKTNKQTNKALKLCSMKDEMH